MLFPFIILLSFACLHIPLNNIIVESCDMGFIQSEHIALYSHAFVISPPFRGHLSAPAHVKSLSFFVCIVAVDEGSSLILHLALPNPFPIWLWVRIQQIGGKLKTGRAVVGIFCYLVSLFSHGG